MNGKGSKRRPTDEPRYQKNYRRVYRATRIVPSGKTIYAMAPDRTLKVKSGFSVAEPNEYEVETSLKMCQIRDILLFNTGRRGRKHGDA